MCPFAATERPVRQRLGRSLSKWIGAPDFGYAVNWIGTLRSSDCPNTRWVDVATDAGHPVEKSRPGPSTTSCAAPASSTEMRTSFSSLYAMLMTLVVLQR